MRPKKKKNQEPLPDLAHPPKLQTGTTTQAKAGKLRVWLRTRNWGDQLIGLVVGILLTLLAIAVPWHVEKEERKDRDQRLVAIVLAGIGDETVKNYYSAQGKAAVTFDNTTLPTDQQSIRYRLTRLTRFGFHRDEYVKWGKDLELVRSLATNGNDVYWAVRDVYGRIDQVEKLEAETIRLIDTEQNPDRRKVLLDEMYPYYDSLETSLRTLGHDLKSLP